MKKIFITGVAALLPVSISFYIIYSLFIFMDDIPANFIEAIFDIRIPGLGFLLTLIVVFFFGLVTQKVASGAVKNFFHKILLKIPIVSTVYGPIKQLIDSFMGDQSESFKEVVLIEYPRKGIYSVAFITSRKKGAPQEIMNSDLVNIFIPTTPNPTSGFFLLVPKENITILPITVEEGLRMVISAGMMYPQDKIDSI